MLYLAIATNVFHALLMVAWIVGIPLLFWRGLPRLSVAYCIFSILFIIVNQVSHYTLGVCIFTTIATWFYNQAGMTVSGEWFAIRISQMVFGATPSHRGITIITQVLIAIGAVGGIHYFYRGRKNNVTGRKEN